jgi:hypothetical protein
MGKLRPIGSERLEGMEKINRIIEISRYKENIPNPVNEVRSTEYGIMLADGNTYKIERDKNGYVIKKSINESDMDYLEPMQNRKYYPSYSQALKRLNLITKEVNTLVGNEENISLFGEQKKFTLKTPKPAPVEAPPMPAPAPAPAPVPAPTDMPPMPDAGMDMPEDPSMGDEGMGMPEDPEMGDEGMDMGDEGMDMGGEPEGEEGMVTFKSIQKLTGKLGQKIRKLNQGEEPISSDDTKYVINSILSALDLSQLSDEDVEEIMTRFEDNEDMGDEDMDIPEEPEMDDAGMDMPEEPEMGDEELPEGEMSEEWEGTMDGDYDLGFSDEPKRRRHPKSPMEEMDFNKAVTNKHSELIKSKMGDMLEDNHADGMGKIFDEIFSESKVDKILSKYFQESPNEKRLNEERGVRKFVEKKTHKVKQMKEVKRLSESIDQEVTSEKFITRYSKAELIGKTNKRNLVFEVNGKQFKITPDGAIL